LLTPRRALNLGTLSTAATPALAQDATAYHLLFIGKSLTYTNNLPQLVEAVFAGAGAKPQHRDGRDAGRRPVQSVVLAADDIGALSSPVGAAWRAALTDISGLLRRRHPSQRRWLLSRSFGK
jgi:hypothetical protein